MVRKLAAGNWKMNGTAENLGEVDALKAALPRPEVDVLICPPTTLLSRVAERLDGSGIGTGGQDCHSVRAGAHTGDISAPMLADAGASHVILGHSERRNDHGETDADVRDKAKGAIAADLTPIICVGETLAEREAANTLAIIGGQLAGSIPDIVTGDRLVIAYEPVWAIGTGKVPDTDQIGEVHDFIRAKLEQRFGVGVGRAVPILYGGSVKAGNAAEIFAVSNVGGALVGGASLKAADFAPIVAALQGA
ncbi:triose-phosphate isomerase [Rhodobacteraceae bacterium W635]|uniref:triose-phosphate isomerase n=1 Tax=Nioella halotolerans TaxID=2303578 RepID=UPI000E3BBC63|nr:triose-phosphate isomerase [Rhodobacteraceae bacterium W635]